MDTRQDNNGVSDLRQNNDTAGTERDDKAGIGQDDKGVDILEQDNKKVVELAAGVCTRARRLLQRAFFLAARSNLFFTFSFLESVLS